jgi:hypothetical protein
MGFWSRIFGKGGSYFLDDETAKGMGDTEYMKQTKTVRRTFPGSVGQEEFEQITQVSAIDGSAYDSRKSEGARPASAAPAAAPVSYGQSSSFGQPSSFGQSSFGQSSFGQSSFGQSSFSQPAATETPAPAPTPEPEAPAPAPAAQRRNTGNVDTSMDMFRNMAKKVGK